jgi:hypothetical protein
MLSERASDRTTINTSEFQQFQLQVPLSTEFSRISGFEWGYRHLFVHCLKLRLICFSLLWPLYNMGRASVSFDSSTGYALASERLYASLIYFRRFERCVGQTQWQCGLRHELILLGRTLGSWVRIPLRAWLFSVCVVCAFLCVCVQVERPCDELITRPRSPTDCSRSSNWSETESFMEAAKAWVGL